MMLIAFMLGVLAGMLFVLWMGETGRIAQDNLTGWLAKSKWRANKP